MKSNTRLTRVHVPNPTPRLSYDGSCPHCISAHNLIVDSKRRCLGCGQWLAEDADDATFDVVARAINILLDHGFNNPIVVHEYVDSGKQVVIQQRMEFRSEANLEIGCSLRSFALNARPNYRYFNSTSRKVVHAHSVPAAVRDAALALTIANTFPGSLRFTEATVDVAGRNFIRMEQSYSNGGSTPEGKALIVRAEFTWFRRSLV